jgi:hypothetical protein
MASSNKPIYGTISKYYHFAMDGEYSSGYNEINVEVTEWWKSGATKNEAKEVKTEHNVYYRHTKANGWREYCKPYKTFTNKNYTGSIINFTPNRKAETQYQYTRVNLGDW